MEFWEVCIHIPVSGYTEVKSGELNRTILMMCSGTLGVHGSEFWFCSSN